MHRKRKLYGRHGRRHALRRVSGLTALVVSSTLLAAALFGWDSP